VFYNKSLSLLNNLSDSASNYR